MNLKIISEQLKREFSNIVSTLPLNELPADFVDIFLKFYKRLFYNLYKQFGISYASTLSCEIGELLISSLPPILSREKTENYLKILKEHTRTILKAMEASNSIDHTHHKSGMMASFYECLTSTERDVYMSYFIETIIGGDESTIVEISKFCVKADLSFEDYLRILSRINVKFTNWKREFLKGINGYEIRF